MRRVVWHTQNDQIPKYCDLRNDQKKSGLKLATPLWQAKKYKKSHLGHGSAIIIDQDMSGHRLLDKKHH
jgi:hypothetical protein